LSRSPPRRRSPPWQALVGFLFAAIDALLADAAIAPVTAAARNVLPRPPPAAVF
jgi:hypothetical protein